MNEPVAIKWVEVEQPRQAEGWQKWVFKNDVIYAVIEHIPSKGWGWEVQVRSEGTLAIPSSTLFHRMELELLPCYSDLEQVKCQVARVIASLLLEIDRQMLRRCEEIAAMSRAKELLRPYQAGDQIRVKGDLGYSFNE